MNILDCKKIFITGGLGFIGGNLIQHFTDIGFTNKIVVYDNNSINNIPIIELCKTMNNVEIIYGDLLEYDKIVSSINDSNIVFHLAANSDISKGVFNPNIDFKNTVVATQNLLQAMLATNVKTIVFSSGSGVYGNISDKFIEEDFGPLTPVSHYGASKLCAESMIASFVFMHNFTGYIFRFANVVGDGQTHGVAYDFIRKLKHSADKLTVLGNGFQKKSYIHIKDILSGIFTVLEKTNQPISYHNIATEDLITVREIANIVVAEMKLKETIIEYGTTNFGWQGDVPIIMLDSNRIRSLGWNNMYTTQQAIISAVKSMLQEYE